MSDVVTGEAVALDLRIAQLPARITAAAIDLLIMAATYLLLGLIGGFTLSGVVDEALSTALYVLLIVGVFLGYPVIMESLTRGRTFGKMALGIRVIRADGGPITFRHALVRGLVGLILERPGLALAGFGPALAVYVCALSKNGRRIGDMAAGTMVLQERAGAGLGWIPWMPAPLTGWAATVDLTRLDDGLALQIRQFLGRTHQLYPAAREQLGHLLASELRQRITPAPPPGTPGWAYLSAVLAERRYREETRAAARAGRPAPPRPIWPPPWPPMPLSYAGGPYPGQPVPYPAQRGAYLDVPGRYPAQQGPYAGTPGQYPAPAEVHVGPSHTYAGSGATYRGQPDPRPAAPAGAAPGAPPARHPEAPSMPAAVPGHAEPSPVAYPGALPVATMPGGSNGGQPAPGTTPDPPDTTDPTTSAAPGRAGSSAPAAAGTHDLPDPAAATAAHPPAAGRPGPAGAEPAGPAPTTQPPSAGPADVAPPPAPTTPSAPVETPGGLGAGETAGLPPGFAPPA
ncbi:MAG: hypothetical protein V7637_6480 [Mycobacteriales bacterium]